MGIFINLMPFAAVLTALVFPAVIAYILWRALVAFERMSLAVEQIARNTRP